MAYSFIQSYSAGLGWTAPPYSSIPINSVVYGSNEYALVWTFYAGNIQASESVSDGVNTYTKLGSVYDSVYNQTSSLFYCSAPVAGTYTVTLSVSVGIDYIGAAVMRFSGLTGTPQAFASNFQQAPGITTDAVTSLNMTPTGQPAAVIGIALCASFNVTTLVPGTGFTDGGVFTDFETVIQNPTRLEHKRITALTDLAATFTTSNNINHFALGVVISEIASRTASISITDGDDSLSAVVDNLITVSVSMSDLEDTLSIRIEHVVATPSNSNISANPITDSSATINWESEGSEDSIEFGDTTDYTTKVQIDSTTPAAPTNENITSSGITDTSATINYDSNTEEESTIEFGDTVAYGQQVLQDAAPKITEVTILKTSPTTRTIIWITDKPSTSQIEFGPSSVYGSTTTEDLALVTSHSQNLTSLGTAIYHFRVVSKDTVGNTTRGNDITFSTDTVAPIISNIVPTVVNNSVVISWNVDKPSSGRIEYGQTTAYGIENPSDGTFTYPAYSQSISLDSLLPSTLYHFRIIAVNEFGAQTASADGTFETGILAVLQAAISISDGMDTLSAYAWTVEAPAIRTVEISATDGADTFSANATIEIQVTIGIIDVDDTFADLSAPHPPVGLAPILLVEASVLSNSVETTRYLSNIGYITEPTDTYPNRNYIPLVVSNIQTTETISITGNASFSFTDIEILNTDGALDSWLLDVWDNRPLQVYLGYRGQYRSEFTLIFDGIIASIGSKNYTTLNLSVRDKLQRLNAPLSETTLGGTSVNKEAIIPYTFGEVFNIEPLLTDDPTHEYQVCGAAIEDIIEVRDLGVPVPVTKHLDTGKFNLHARPAGSITCSVQGYKPVNYLNDVANSIKNIVLNFGKATDVFQLSDIDTSNFTAFTSAHPEAIGYYVDSKENIISIIQAIANSVGAQLLCNRLGKLQLFQVDVSGTPVFTITQSMMTAKSLAIASRVTVQSSIILNYCKNWVMQEVLDTGIVTDSKELFKKEWDTITKTDSLVAAAYKQTALPEPVDTYLVNTAETDAEATRRLSLWKVPRTVYQFQGTKQLSSIRIGDIVILQHPRFNLSEGRQGMVISVAIDWNTLRPTLQVLV